MDEQTRLIIKKMDELLQFLPAFAEPNRQFIERWEQFYPAYTPDVMAFYAQAGHSWWMDTEYEPAQARQMLYDESVVQNASLDEVKIMLTYCVRSERFGDGNWGGLLENGRVHSLLHRLQTLRKELDAA